MSLMPRTPRGLARILAILLVIWLLLLLWDLLDFLAPGLIFNLHFLRYRMGMARCGMRKDPLVQLLDSRSVSVTWETNCRMPKSQFRWKIRATPQQASGKSRAFGRYSTLEEEQEEPGDEHSIGISGHEQFSLGKGHHLYRVILTDLPPGRWCEYRVQLEATRWPYVGIFPTPPPEVSDTLPDTPLSVALFGDNHGGVLTFTRLLRLAKRRHPHLLVHLGDMVQHAYSLRDWETFFWLPLAKHQLGSRRPMIMVPGNHDAILGDRSEYFGPVGSQLDERLAANDRHALRQHAYHALTTGPIRWLILDGNEESDSQVRWLEQELQTPATQRAPFRLVLLHIPPFIEYWNRNLWSKHGENSWPVYARTRLNPLFERHRVDLVISGHQHNYQRGFRNGIHYVVAGGAGGDLDREQVEQTGVYQHTHLVHHYLHLNATREMLHLQCFSLQDRLLDSVDIPRATIRKIKAAE